ncbi:MAG: hypothetical protein KJZ68_15270, partial [Phycisphaerales bacterium]|nr:hypothetical protein [Phycisphaerales bacterium]
IFMSAYFQVGRVSGIHLPGALLDQDSRVSVRSARKNEGTGSVQQATSHQPFSHRSENQDG